jgi:hypothetical protein
MRHLMNRFLDLIAKLVFLQLHKHTFTHDVTGVLSPHILLNLDAFLGRARNDLYQVKPHHEPLYCARTKMRYLHYPDSHIEQVLFLPIPAPTHLPSPSLVLRHYLKYTLSPKRKSI